VQQDDFLWNTNDPTNANDPAPEKGATDPCPTGYRIPTEAELNAERLSWVQPPISSIDNAAGAFNSPLKLPAAGYREGSDGSFVLVGSFGLYWSSTVSGASARNLYFDSSVAVTTNLIRPNGLSVRCIKD